MEDLEIPGCTLLVTSAAQPLYGLVREAHESLIAPTFAASEVEDVELWIERIKTQQQLGLRSGFELALEMSLHQTKRSEKKMKKKTSTRNNSFSTNDSFASGSLSRSGSKQLIASMMSIPRRNSTSHHGSGSGCCTTEDTTPLVFFNQTASSNSQQPTAQHREMASIVQVCQQQRRGSAGAVDDAPSGSDDGPSSASSDDHHGGGSRGSGGGKYEHHHSHHNHPHRDAHSHASTTTPSSLVHSEHDWEFYLALVVHNESGDVVGVAVHEVYLRAGCGLVSYVVVDPSMRGQGIAQVLMEAAYRNCAVVTRTRGVRSEHEIDRDHMATFHALFIEVLNVRDDPLSESDPTNSRCSVVRQKVFKKLGFVPLEMDLVHPGRMKGKRYNLAFRSKVHVPQPNSPKREDDDPQAEQRQEEDSSVSGDVTHFPTRILLLFLEDLFAGILGDEGVHDDNRDYRAYEQQFSDQKTIKAAEEFWR